MPTKGYRSMPVCHGMHGMACMVHLVHAECVRTYTSHVRGNVATAKATSSGLQVAMQQGRMRISGSVSASEGARTCVERDGPPSHQAVQAVVVNFVDCRAWRTRRWRQQCSTAGKEQSFWWSQSKYTVGPLRRSCSAPYLTGSKDTYAASVSNGTVRR